MKFLCEHTSDYKQFYVEINSLEELIEFAKKHEHQIILTPSLDGSELNKIEIYDDYRE
jgi:Holliday junction resolvase